MKKEMYVISSIVVLICSLLFVNGILDFTNISNMWEINLEAKYDNNKTEYQNFVLQLKDSFKIAETYSEQFTSNLDKYMTGRYGDNGNQATVLFLAESNINLDPTLLANVQQSLSSFRTNFINKQNELVSMRKDYRVYLRATTEGRFYNLIFDYPHVDLDKYDIISSSNTEKVFGSKLEENGIF